MALMGNLEDSEAQGYLNLSKPWTDTIQRYVPRKAFFCRQSLMDEKKLINYQKILTDKGWQDVHYNVSYGYNNRYLDPDFGSNFNPPNPHRRLTNMSLSRPGSVVVWRTQADCMRAGMQVGGSM